MQQVSSKFDTLLCQRINRTEVVLNQAWFTRAILQLEHDKNCISRKEFLFHKNGYLLFGMPVIS